MVEGKLVAAKRERDAAVGEAKALAAQVSLYVYIYNRWRGCGVRLFIRHTLRYGCLYDRWRGCGGSWTRSETS